MREAAAAPDAGPPSGDSDETRLWTHFAQSRDLDSRNALIELHMDYARAIAATLYARRGGIPVEFVDFMQLATLGLIASVDSFDPGRGVRFQTYALPRIRGMVLNHLGDLSEKYEQVSLRKRLRQDRLEALAQGRPGGKRPRSDLLADLSDVAVGLALSYMLEDTGMMLPEADRAARHEFYDSTATRDLRETLGRLVHALPDRERRVVRYHYYQGLSFTEIAELLGLTKGRISQIHQQALELIRRARAELQGLDMKA